tara:strand:+ start:973 stop:2280 length:1308 start_codon:yes stop_codon:yes gene_type:complete
MGSIRDFFDDVGDALVPKEIAPYLGVIAPMIPGIGIMGTMALSQLGSMKMNAGKLDPYAAAAAAISLSTPEQKALRAAGRMDPSKGTVGQKLSAGIGNFFGGADTRLGRAFDPTRSMFQFTSGGKGSYFENPIMAGLDTGTFGSSKLPDAIKNNPTLAEFVKNKGPQQVGGSENVSEFAKQNFDTVAQETYDLKYGKPLTAAEVKDEVGEEVYNKMTADELKAAQEAGRTGGTIDDSFLQQAGEMGSQLAGEIIPGFRDLDPVTGAVTSKFNFGKALQTVSVAGTLGSLNMLAEELKKQKQLDEQKQREIWSTWFDSYQRTTGRSYDQSMYPDPILLEKFNRFMLATGGRVGYNMGGLSGGIMGSSGVPEGMQVDGRNGTFIPMGVQEKADDVPAMLSKNEFVMTADAVKAAGDGDANKGAQRMYDLMHNLEAQV